MEHCNQIKLDQKQTNLFLMYQSQIQMVHCNDGITYGRKSKHFLQVSPTLVSKSTP